MSISAFLLASVLKEGKAVCESYICPQCLGGRYMEVVEGSKSHLIYFVPQSVFLTALMNGLTFNKRLLCLSCSIWNINIDVWKQYQPFWCKWHGCKGCSQLVTEWFQFDFSSWCQCDKYRTTTGERGQFSSKSLTGTSEQLLKYDNSQNLDKTLCFQFSKRVYLGKNPTQLNNIKSPHILCVTNDFVNKKLTTC